MARQNINAQRTSATTRPKWVKPKTIAEQIARNKETKHYKLSISGNSEGRLDSLPEELLELVHLK